MSRDREQIRTNEAKKHTRRIHTFPPKKKLSFPPLIHKFVALKNSRTQLQLLALIVSTLRDTIYIYIYKKRGLELLLRMA